VIGLVMEARRNRVVSLMGRSDWDDRVP